ncbi:hypothetical protein [Kineosporia sp. R_H_3]|uniref:ribbon-helix-helix domain-containing protein n=1 Tax=Kineosporia sp. R_H_3 TaxID=1961848 RepID=UPI000B4A8C09|nr:hypothetical protein [Kineosporia sp. R_H_3]
MTEKHVKMSITVPQAVADRITAAVESGAYPTASAVIADAVGTRLTPRETRVAIDRLREGRPIDEDAMAYWRERLAPESAQAAAS